MEEKKEEGPGAGRQETNMPINRELSEGRLTMHLASCATRDPITEAHTRLSPTKGLPTDSFS